MVKFIHYNDDYDLCDGILTLDIDGVIFKFGNHKGCDFPKFWQSGGSWDLDGHITTGPWELQSSEYDRNKILKMFDIFDDPYGTLVECLKVMNANVKWGCCGDCI